MTAVQQIAQDVEGDPEQILDLIVGHWKAKALFVALEAGLFELLSDQSLSRNEIKAHLGWPQRSVDALLDACFGLGLLDGPDDGVCLSYVARTFLVAGKGSYLGDWAQEENRTFDLWNDLGSALESGEPVERTDQHGYFQAPKEFHRFLHGTSTRIARELCDEIDFGGQTILDFGGGSGAFASEIGRRYPDSRVTVLDRPEVCEVAEEAMAGTSGSERVSFLPADFFTATIEGRFDAVLIANVLHDWNFEQGQILIDKACSALRPNGRIVVVEVTPSKDRSENPVSAMLSLSFCLSLDFAYCHEERRYVELLTSCGLAVSKSFYLSATQKLVICAKRQ